MSTIFCCKDEVMILNLSFLTRAECGGEFTFFLSENNIIMSCGNGSRGQLGQGDLRDYHRYVLSLILCNIG